MIDFFATLGIFTGILAFIVLGLYLLSGWHRRIETRLRPRQKYPTISRADLDVEAAAAECGYFHLQDHILHVRKFEGRHHDAA